MKPESLIPPRIACVSQKGGGGKSMLAVNLAVAAALDGRRPALFDLDPQKSAHGLWDTLRHRRQKPAPIAVKGMGWDDLAPELEALKGDKAGLVIIDTPGSRDQVSSLAASASNIVLVAVQTPMVDLATLRATFKLKNVTNRPAFVVLNRVRNKANLKEARAIVAEMGFELCPVAISDLGAFPDAYDQGLGVLEYAQEEGWTRKAATELAAAQQEIRELYAWAMQMVGANMNIRLAAKPANWDARQ